MLLGLPPSLWSSSEPRTNYFLILAYICLAWPLVFNTIHNTGLPKFYCLFPLFFLIFWFQVLQRGVKRNGRMALKISDKIFLNILEVPIKVHAKLELLVVIVPIIIPYLIVEASLFLVLGLFPTNAWQTRTISL